MGGGGLGIGTIVVLGIIGYALGIDPRILIGGAEMMSGGGQQQQAPQSKGKTGAPSDDMGKFVARVLGSADVQWKLIFEQAGQRYRPPTLVMFNGATRADQCGMAQSAMGPFYCPGDQKIYLDTSFFRDIERRFKGCDTGSRSCQFAQAYVIAHEVGHHVQTLLGISDKVRQVQQSGDTAAGNAEQVKMELQADCYAGVWAANDQNLLQPGDVEEGLRAAQAIGDDTLQKAAGQRPVPESFTHGTAEQRMYWLKRGLDTESEAGTSDGRVAS